MCVFVSLQFVAFPSRPFLAMAVRGTSLSVPDLGTSSDGKVAPRGERRRREKTFNQQLMDMMVSIRSDMQVLQHTLGD